MLFLCETSQNIVTGGCMLLCSVCLLDENSRCMEIGSLLYFSVRLSCNPGNTNAFTCLYCAYPMVIFYIHIIYVILEL
jgi:hypothetical protein